MAPQHDTPETGSAQAARQLGAAAARAALLGAMLWTLTACTSCRQNPLVNERDPYYRRGTKLLEEHKFEEAAEAFGKALRFNPESVKAHLQLAMLNEDVLDDPVTALYHYRKYLEKAPESNDADTVRKWMLRTESVLLHRLATGREEPAQSTSESPARRSEPQNEPDVPPVTDRERALAERVKELHTQVLALKRDLARAEAALADKRGPPPAPQPRTPPAVAENTERLAGPAAAQPPASSTDTQTPRRHTVRRGETLSSLARTYYGTLRYWPALRDANQDVLKGSDVLRPGMVLIIPPLEELKP